MTRAERVVAGMSRAARFDVICAGEVLWALGPGAANAPSLGFRPSGGALNAALALAQRRLRVGLAAALPDDAYGRALLARLESARVDVGGVVLSPTRGSLVLVEGSDAVVHHGAEEELPMGVPEAWTADVLLLSGVPPALSPLAALCKAARGARRAGAAVVVDLNVRRHVWAGRDPRALRALLREADVVRCSAADLAALWIDPTTVRAAMRPDAVLVTTNGPAPARAAGPFGTIDVAPPRAAERAPAGAGDAFTAAVCAELARAGDLGADRVQTWERALRAGHAAAAMRTLP